MTTTTTNTTATLATERIAPRLDVPAIGRRLLALGYPIEAVARAMTTLQDAEWTLEARRARGRALRMARTGKKRKAAVIAARADEPSVLSLVAR